jgi:hypothetical protein
MNKPQIDIELLNSLQSITEGHTYDVVADTLTALIFKFIFEMQDDLFPNKSFQDVKCKFLGQLKNNLDLLDRYRKEEIENE